MEWPATYGVREIRGTRRDLTGVRDFHLDKLTLLEVKGRGIASLRGIERFHGLAWLQLSNLVEPDLDVLRDLDELVHLELAALQGDVNYRPVEHLKNLRSLTLAPPTPSAARRMLASLDLAQLPALESLHLRLDRPQCPVSLAFSDALPNLEELTLIDFVVEEDQLEHLAARRAPLKSLTLTARDDDETDRLYEAVRNFRALPEDLDVYEQHLYLENRPALRVDSHKTGHVLSADMATEWGLGDNVAAEAHLRRWLTDARPDIERQLTWTSDVGELIAWADRPEPVRALEAFIAGRPARHKFSVSSRALRRQRAETD